MFVFNSLNLPYFHDRVITSKTKQAKYHNYLRINQKLLFNRNMPRQSIIIFLIIISIVGVGLRSYELTARSLWFDEAFSWRLIQFPFSEMIARDATDVHPPLYYILLKLWSVIFATSLISLRSFSVLFAGFTILAGYLFTSYAMRSQLAGIIAAVLLALSGFQIQFAWEARMYTVGTFLVLLSSWLLLRALRRHSTANWVLYALSISALSYIHYYAFFSIAAQALFIGGYIIVLTKGRLGEILQLRIFWLATGSFILAVTLFIPWLPTFLSQNSQVQESYWIPGIGGWSIPDTFYRMFAPTSGIPNHTGVGWILLAMLPVAATCLGWLLLILLIKRSSNTASSVYDATWLIFLSGTIPFVISIILSFLGQSLYQDRFFVFAHLFIIIGLAVLLSRIPIRSIRIGVITIVFAGFFFAFTSYWSELGIKAKPGARRATETMVNQLEPEDKIIVSSPFIYFSILHYINEDYDLGFEPKLYSESGQLSHFAGGPILINKDVIGPEVFNQNSSLWVVDTTGFGSSKLSPPQNWQLLSSEVFPEVFTHQGEVIINHYKKN